MNVLILLNIFLLFMMLFGSFFLVLSKNPVYSVFFLIAIFFIASFRLILFQIDFIGLLLLIIYVGAIAVLFLFVVMMLELKFQNISYLDIRIIFILFFFVSFVFNSFYNSSYFSFFNKKYSIATISFENIDSFNNIDVFGQCLFNYFGITFLIIGLILLIAMLGAIVLTLKFNNNIRLRNQLIYKKLSRSNNFLSYFI